MISTPNHRSSPPKPIVSAAGFGLMELTTAAGLRAQILPSGALFALRHRETLINQVLPGPAEDGLFRVIVRWRPTADATAEAAATSWAPLVGAGMRFGIHEGAAGWSTSPPNSGLHCSTTLALDPAGRGWAWRIRVHNTGSAAVRFDVLHAQDLGLADEGAVRNNEAYVSQYIDLLPVRDPQFGHVILARQNQPMAGGRRPWLAVACATGASAYCTDGWQFFGADHRLTGVPAAVRDPRLPSKRLQYEFAVAGLQSREMELGAGMRSEVLFAARFIEDHPAASGPDDLDILRSLLPLDWIPPLPGMAAPTVPASVFIHAPWLHGSSPNDSDLEAWFPGPRRHEETNARGRLLSFFHGGGTHVVTREKEAHVARPHGHILRSGEFRWIDDGQFGVTCYAAGIFGAQAYLGNPSLARLLSVVRNPLNVARASGQRVFVRRGGAWCQLGVPTVFAIEPGLVRWLYRLDEGTIEVRAWCSHALPASFLELRVSGGAPCTFLITHHLALGAHEFDAGGTLAIHADRWVALSPEADGFLAKHQMGIHFAVAAADPAAFAEHGGDGSLFADGITRGGPYVCFTSAPTNWCAVILLGTHDGPDGLPELVDLARAEYRTGAVAAASPAAPMRLRGTNDAAVSRIDEILPWFTYNAAIHFSAPHGLEQYGGAAWGVRDVTQGSLEWLLAAGEYAVVRRMLTTVFAQQYLHDGSWPQWFMFPPFQFIQQAHSHGDVCFWPLKALCDYVEASGDLTFVDTHVGYTDPQRFEGTGPEESLWAHCDRTLAQVEARFVPGTALVNYGDGDWDDTLQPADPAMRTRMVSSWTVALAFHTFSQLAEICRRCGRESRAVRLEALLARMRQDFATHAMPGGVVAGFLIHEDNHMRPLLHPKDQVTRIRHRLLPMTRSILAGLFTADEAARHAAIIDAELRFSDGVRLMSEPVTYHGGVEMLFKRADTAANVGREIGLQYVHAHLRYAEAMARLGHAERLWTALQVINPVALSAVVPNAVMRQSNVYFSSSDADFADRNEAVARWNDLRAGHVPVRGGWRLYSSGPGLFLHAVRSSLLGIRESFGDIIFDPVLPRSLDGLVAETRLCGREVEVLYRVRHSTSGTRLVTVNGTPLQHAERVPEPYRTGGLRVAAAELAARLAEGNATVGVEL